MNAINEIDDLGIFVEKRVMCKCTKLQCPALPLCFNPARDHVSQNWADTMTKAETAARGARRLLNDTCAKDIDHTR